MSETDYPSDTLQDFTPEPAEPRRIVVLISGNGSNLQALIEAQEHDRLGGEIAAVISNQPDAYGLKRLAMLASTPWRCPIGNTRAVKPSMVR